MTIEECYKSFGEDIKDVLSRLLELSRVENFALMFLDTTDFDELSKAIENKDWDKAFLAAHTIKGIALNLGFSKYAQSSSELCELLRPREVSNYEKLDFLFEKTKNDYEKIVKSLKEFKAQKK